MQLDPVRALRIIEGLCCLSEDLMGDTIQGKLIDQIYTVAHCAQTDHSCSDVHDNWREEALKIEEELVKAKIFKPFGEKDINIELPHA